MEKDGTLLCSYHAWRFDGSGSCTAIPQAEKGQQAAVCASPRACARAYPTREAQGLLWVWGESGPDAEAESSRGTLRLIDELVEVGT